MSKRLALKSAKAADANLGVSWLTHRPQSTVPRTRHQVCLAPAEVAHGILFGSRRGMWLDFRWQVRSHWVRSRSPPRIGIVGLWLHGSNYNAAHGTGFRLTRGTWCWIWKGSRYVVQGVSGLTVPWYS
jgi:hypothetical protein